MTENMRSCIKGLILSLFGSPLPAAPSREPVAYLYNGVRLPGLPEWDKETYPDVIILKNYNLIIAEKPFYFGRNSANPHWLGTDGNFQFFIYKTDGWEEGSKLPPGEIATGNAPGDIIWANHDILNADGTIYLTASEPVPVYT